MRVRPILLAPVVHDENCQTDSRVRGLSTVVFGFAGPVLWDIEVVVTQSVLVGNVAVDGK